MPTATQGSINRGKGLSSFLAGDGSKVNPVLWFFLLFLNALYTVIGVRLRDLRPNGACELNVNRTIGIVEHFDRVGLFWGLLSIYPIISIVIVLVQIVFHVLHRSKDKETAERQKQEAQGDKGNHDNQGKLGNQENHLDHPEQRNQSDQRYLGDRRDQAVQVDQRYLGGPRDQEVQVDLGHCILHKKQRACIQNVLEILHILSVNLLVIISGSFYIAADNFFFLVDPDHQSHDPSTTRGFIAGSSLICSVAVFAVDQCFTQLVPKCLEKCKYVEETNNDNTPDENENGVNVIKILYFWSPLAVLITTCDSIFISVVDEISGEDDVRNGFDCSNERGIEGAIIFYIAICIVFSISSGAFVVFMIIHKLEYLPKCSSRNWSCCFAYLWYIVHFPLIGIAFVITGLMFIAADNNWPWICLAKNEGDICSWVIVRVGFLAVVTVFSILFFLSSAALSLLKYCATLERNLNPAETTNTSVHSNEQSNTAASGAKMQTSYTARGNDRTLDGQLTANENLTTESFTITFAEAESEC